MKNKSVFTRVLAIAGTAFVWLPILFTILTGIAGSLSEGKLLVDYLLPAELFPSVLIGGLLLLLWAAIRIRSRLKMIVWGLGLMAASLGGGMLYAVVSGLASGQTEPVGFNVILLNFLIVIYILTVIEVGIVGILLIKDSFAIKS